MYTQVIMGVFFWWAMVFFACWLVVELSELARKTRRDAATRAKLGIDERPGASAWEDRMRVYAAENPEDAEPARRG